VISFNTGRPELHKLGEFARYSGRTLPRQGEAVIAYELEHLFTYSAALKPAEVVGEVPERFRVNYWVTVTRRSAFSALRRGDANR